eukprot:jgi/Psemu1/66789/estExt_Genemark1.C_2410040
MTAASKRPNPVKVKKSTVTAKITAPKTASSGIKHQVILPKSSSVMPSPSSSISSTTNKNSSSSLQPLNDNAGFTSNGAFANVTHHPSSCIVKSPGRASKKNGVWYLGGNHIVKLLTSVDGDLDHSVLSRLAAVPSVVGELALSVESLVSDDITVGGFENDLLAKIASNTLTAKRGIMAAKAALVNVTPKPSCTTPPPTTTFAQTSAATASTNANMNMSTATPSSSEQVPNPLLANYQPVPNPLAIRITPPASPHTTTSIVEQNSTTATSPKTIRAEGLPMIHAR